MQTVLNLRVGELVQVKSAEEIRATLDERGELDSLPFMPEMLRFCGKRFRVYRRADKACDTIDWSTLRRMENAVHLAQLRCDGCAHGGCQAGCLLYCARRPSSSARRRYPFLNGRERRKHLAEGLNLQPGDMVQVKSKDEIVTLVERVADTRGLRFDRETCAPSRRAPDASLLRPARAASFPVFS